jgi:hypothetical protein
MEHLVRGNCASQVRIVSVAAVSYRREIQTLLSSSPYYLRMADSILARLDREILADLIVSYVYFKSKGKTNSEFAKFIMTDKLPQILPIVLAGAPVILSAIFSDKAFRALVLDIALGRL